MKGSMTGIGSEYCCNNNVRYEGKCCVIVKVYPEIVHVHICVRVRPCLPFPLTTLKMIVWVAMYYQVNVVPLYSYSYYKPPEVSYVQ